MGEAVLKITEKVSEGACIIVLSGDIDAHTAPSFKDAIEKNIEAGNVRIVFDFSALNYISSAGIGVLNSALNTVKGKGGKMSIACANKTVYDTLDVMYFTKKIPVRNDLGSSIKEVTAS
jgi:anti-sigma B factor antagonist